MYLIRIRKVAGLLHEFEFILDSQDSGTVPVDLVREHSYYKRRARRRAGLVQLTCLFMVVTVA